MKSGDERKHTAGPWKAHKLPMDRWLISASGENVAGTASGGFGPNDDAREAANARRDNAAELAGIQSLAGRI